MRVADTPNIRCTWSGLDEGLVLPAHCLVQAVTYPDARSLDPQLYTDFMRSGHATAVRRVFYYNCEDIVWMVALAEHLGRRFMG